MNTLLVNDNPEVSEEYPHGLQEKQFYQSAKNGFGDGGNAYAHAMVWFNENLYVGTTRHVLALLYNRFEALQSWEIYPVKYSKELDIRGQIWKYHPDSSTWTKVLTSPLITTSDGSEVPVFQGIRNLVVFQGKTDKKPTLYASTWSPEKGLGCLLLRSEDGLNFEEIRIIVPVEMVTTFRPMVVFKGRLFIGSTGKTGQGNAGGLAAIFENEDPLNESWQQVNETNFGDPYNLSIFEMTVFNNHLYAATVNPQGFQLWKTDAEGKPPYHWKKVLTNGAERGPLNEGIGSMCVFNDALYLGTIIQNGGYDRKFGIGPGAAELIRLYPDDTWELIVGDSRMTEKGLKIPLSGFGPGFDNFFNGYFWRMCVYDDWLYLGTFKWAFFLSYAPRDKWPPEKRNMLDTYRTKNLINKCGGADLWRSREGIVWQQVTRNGFGNPCNYGIRTMVSTPYGLFVGTANPFGPEIKIKRSSGWVYEKNLQGGLEVWVGSRNFPQTPLPCAADKSLSCSDSTDFCEEVISQYYERSNFRIFGYWQKDTDRVKQACENLMEEILSYIPEKKGKILDLACGYGATTEYLLKYYLADVIMGICLEKEELDKAKGNVQKIKFLRSSIPQLKQPDNSFETIINVERLSECRTGIEWLREAVRVLKPGGYLICSEILSTNSISPWKKKNGWKNSPMTTANDFKELLESLGLKEVKVYDATQECWKLFHKNLLSFLWEKLLKNEIDKKMQEKIKKLIYDRYMPISAYVLAAGRK